MKEIQVHTLIESWDLKKYLESYIQDDIFHVRFLFESSFQNAKVLRDTMDIICSSMWLDSKWKTRMVLIVDELNNNAIEYGSKSEEINTLEVYLEKQSKWEFYIKISVEDTGNGEHAKTAQEMDKMREERINKWFKNHNSIRGRGLFMIISNLVDTLYFKDSENNGKGLVVWIEKKL